jgi:hypothetical protein
MRNGALSKITYPTGGSMSYDFEPNTTWISTTRYTNIFRSSYSVGYNGNNNAAYNNVTFTNNHYQITISNNTCPTGYAYVCSHSMDQKDRRVSHVFFDCRWRAVYNWGNANSRGNL